MSPCNYLTAIEGNFLDISIIKFSDNQMIYKKKKEYYFDSFPHNDFRVSMTRNQLQKAAYENIIDFTLFNSEAILTNFKSLDYKMLVQIIDFT